VDSHNQATIHFVIVNPGKVAGKVRNNVDACRIGSWTATAKNLPKVHHSILGTATRLVPMKL